MKTELKNKLCGNDKNRIDIQLNNIEKLQKKVKKEQPLDQAACLAYLKAQKKLAKCNDLIAQYNNKVQKYQDEAIRVLKSIKFKYRDILIDYKDDDIEIDLKNGGFVLPQLWFFLDNFGIDENNNEVWYEGANAFGVIEWCLTYLDATENKNLQVNLMPNIEKDFETLVHSCNELECFAVLEKEANPTGDNPQIIKNVKTLKKMLKTQAQNIKTNLSTILKMYEYILNEVFATKKLYEDCKNR